MAGQRVCRFPAGGPAAHSSRSPLGNLVLGLRGLLGLAAVGLFMAIWSERDASSLWRTLVVWVYALSHMCYVVYGNFRHAFLVRMVLFMLNVTYMPAAAACIRRMEYIEPMKNSVGDSFRDINASYTFGYIVLVPLIQFCTLRAIQ